MKIDGNKYQIEACISTDSFEYETWITHIDTAYEWRNLLRLATYWIVQQV